MIADLVGRIRSLRQQPLLSAATIVTLGVGSAVCCVGVSLLDSILCNPLPYPESDRLVIAWSVKLDEPDRVRPVSRRAFDEWKRTNRSFAQLAALRDWPFLMAGSSGPVNSIAARWSARNSCQFSLRTCLLADTSPRRTLAAAEPIRPSSAIVFGRSALGHTPP